MEKLKYHIRVPALRQGLLKRFEHMGEPVSFAEGHYVAVPGYTPKICYFITSGRVTGGLISSVESQRILLAYERGTLMLVQYMLTAKPCNMYFRAVEHTTARLITYNELTEAMKRDFSLTLDIIDAVSALGELAHERRRFEEAADATDKVISLLLDFAMSFGTEAGEGVIINERISQTKIGALGGLHRVTVSRELKRLRDLGLIDMVDGCYRIISIDAMLRYRDGHERGERA